MSDSSAASNMAVSTSKGGNVVLLSALAGAGLLLLFTGIVLCCRIMRRATSPEQREKARETARRKIDEKREALLLRMEEGEDAATSAIDKKKKKKKKDKKQKSGGEDEAAALREEMRVLASHKKSARHLVEEEEIELKAQNDSEELGWHRTIVAPDGTTFVLENDDLETLVMGKTLHALTAENATKSLAKAGAFLPTAPRAIPIPPDYRPPPWFPTLDSEKSAIKLQRSFEAAVEETFEALVRPPPLPLLPPALSAANAEAQGSFRALASAGKVFGSMAGSEKLRLVTVHPTEFLKMSLTAPDEKHRMAALRRKAEEIVFEAIRKDREAKGGAGAIAGGDPVGQPTSKEDADAYL